MNIKKLVIDSSVIIKWLAKENELYLEEAKSILLDAQQNLIELYSPELSKYEVGNVLVKGKNLPDKTVICILEDFYNLPLVFIPETYELSSDSYTFAKKFGITYYDAAFLSLAKFLNAALVTDNVKHQGKATDIDIIPLADYKSYL